MSFIDRFLSNLGQILGNDLIFFGFVFVIGELIGLADKLNDIFEFHILLNFLHIDSQCFYLDV